MSPTDPPQSAGNEPAWQILAGYHFAPVADPQDWCQRLTELAQRDDLCGIVLVAPEGINGTISGIGDRAASFWQQVAADLGAEAICTHATSHPTKPFRKLKIRAKRELVPLGDPDCNPTRDVGTYVDPAQWDALLAREDLHLIDCRNSFEWRMGHFAGAVDPGTIKFAEFADWAEEHLPKQDPVAMYCTGGIRCEKATAWMKEQGWQEVYHLAGGILNYLSTVPEERSSWQGSCFVFDQRIGIDHRLSAGNWTNCGCCTEPVNRNAEHCPQCGEPLPAPASKPEMAAAKGS